MRETAFQAVDRWEYDGSPPFKAAQQFATELAAVEDVKLKGLPAERQEAARRDSAGVRAAYGLHIAQRAQHASVEAPHEKIGRASCRGRVWQYVEVLVVAG